MVAIGAFLILAAGIVMPIGVTLAQNWNSIAAGDATAGRELVEKSCGSCHAQGYTGQLTSGSALTQDDLAHRVTDRSHLMRAFYFDRHPSMPRFLFGDYEVNNILAYFAQLRSGDMQQPYPRSWTR